MSEQSRVCSNIPCQLTRKGVRANWFNQSNKTWLCFQCAQSRNRDALQLQLKYGGKQYRPCISEEEYTFQLLTEGAA